MLVRPARPDDAAGIAAVHVAAWQAAYAGILPEAFLAGMSRRRQAAYYHARIVAGPGVFVAADPAVVGFATAGRPRTPGLGDGEVETLYVLDDWREQGVGRGLLRAAAAHLHGAGCGSMFLWVLRDNPSRWFYQRMGGRAAMESNVRVAGTAVPQIAFVWDPIGPLLDLSPSPSGKGPG